MTFLKVTCYLESPVVFDLPIMLDGLLEYRSCHVNKIGGGALSRHDPAPIYGEIPLPIKRENFGEYLIPKCSYPIYQADYEWHEHYCRRFPTDRVDLFDQSQLTKINTTGGEFKSYRLPARARLINKIVWFCEGTRKPLLKLVKGVPSLGKKRSMGYGKITRWEAERVDKDYSWYCDREGQLLLMRPLPKSDDLPETLTGYRDDYGAVQSPYWHPDRQIERIVPC